MECGFKYMKYQSKSLLFVTKCPLNHTCSRCIDPDGIWKHYCLKKNSFIPIDQPSRAYLTNYQDTVLSLLPLLLMVLYRS